MESVSFKILLVGITIVASIIVKYCLERNRLPALTGFLTIGFVLRTSDQFHGFLSEGVLEIYEFLSYIGLIVLLFRVGLESKVGGLLKQLRRAAPIWLGDVVVSAGAGYLFARYLAGLPLVPSIFVAASLTATSVGVSASVWQERKVVATPNGELLIDVAELDDISGIVLMALLFSVLPALRSGAGTELFSILFNITAVFLFKMFVFSVFCILFALYAERPLMGFYRKIEPAPDPMLLVAGTGFIVASGAELFGFSIAIGSFFAGLVFSRDPRSVKIDASFNSLYELFVPFFFIGIGLNIDPATLSAGIGLGLLILIGAVLGKLVGAGGVTFLTAGWTSSALIGVSMLPRAEIAMVIMEKALNLGTWAMPSYVFSAMVMVSLVTCMASPVVLRKLLAAWPQDEVAER